MTKLLTTIIILIFFAQINAQDYSKVKLDSLFNNFTFIRGVKLSDLHQKQVDENPESIKCGMQLVNSIKQNLEYFSHEQQQVLIPLLQRPITQTSTFSPNGFFRVHYDVNGNNAIGYDLNLLLQALDSVYTFEITSLGFPPPPSDDTSGGDGKYDIYIRNLSGVYGQTWYENSVGVTNWTGYIEIDNDFGTEFYTHGIEAARVTVAHEFHHAIQLGNYAQYNNNVNPIRGSDGYFYELTSTSFEEFVFDDVNDYKYYIGHYFQNSDKPISSSIPYSLDGYDLAIWNIYLQKNFGFDILKNQWELIPTTPAIKAIALSIENIRVDSNRTNLGNELNKFGIWCYFTNTRNVYPGEYFDDADIYPLLIPTATMNFNSSSQTYNMSINPTANYFFQLNLPSSDGVFFTIITNSDWQKAIDDNAQFLDFSFSIYHDSSSGEKILNENYSVSFSRDNQTFWNNAGILNNIVVYGDSNYFIPNLERDTYAYPAPYKKSSLGNIKIAFPANLSLGEEVDLNIYSAGLELVYMGKKNIQYSYLKDSKKYCEVILKDSDIDFPSGVYIYVIKSGDDIYKGKLVIFND